MSAELAARRLILIDRIVRLSAEKVSEAERALDEIESEIVAASPESLGRSLHAIVDPRPWEELSDAMRGWFVHGATRLRKRWGCDDSAELRRLLALAEEHRDVARAGERSLLEDMEKMEAERNAARNMVRSYADRLAGLESAASSLRAELSAAMSTLEAATENYDFVSEALEALRVRANDVVRVFESSGARHVGAPIQDLRKALYVFGSR